MNRINPYSQVNSGYYQNTTTKNNTNEKEKNKENKVNSNQVSGSTSDIEDKKKVTGMRTYGDAKLSDNALEYYKSLTKKYGNLNFVLVAADKKQEAEMMKGSFASSNGLTVLIDTDKIEKMASDEKYAKKIESVLNNASTQLNSLKTSLSSNPNVKSYGMSINKDNRASFFATVDKQMKEQRDRIKERREQKKADKKAEEKAEAKKEAKEKLADERKAKVEDKDTVTIEANSVEELKKKIEAYEKYGILDEDSEKASKYNKENNGKVDYYI